MSEDIAFPQCLIDIFPFEGGRFSIQGGQVLQCTTNKNIKADEGAFTIQLAPGGPNGPNGRPSWTDVITQGSLVIIGMTRGSRQAITMIGIVKTCSENQEWSQGPVQRAITVQGMDFSHYFATFNWCALTFLGTPAAAIGQNLGSAAAGLPAILGGNLLSGPPNIVAAAWFNQIMAGPNGVLSRTQVQYRGSPVGFSAAVAQWFEAYPNFVIPFGDYFIASEGTWIGKFKSILPFPWYEFFVITAPPGFYKNAVGGTQFGVNGMNPSITAAPTIVGRVNPLPRIPVAINGAQTSFGAVDLAAWNALPVYIPDFGFIRNSVTYSDDEVKNFYLLNPSWFQRMFGDSNSALISFLFSFVGAADPASIHRYGYRPEYAETRWIYDPNGTYGQSGQIDINSLVADLIGRLFSYYHPTPLMARAEVSYKLSPTIMPGNRFRYTPFKAQPTYDFYIEGVTHQYTFGGPSTTSLALSRGMPTSVYGDGALGGILTQAHLGNAQRKEGIYEVGLPEGSAPPLTAFGLGDGQTDNVLGNIAQIYVTPQAK